MFQIILKLIIYSVLRLEYKKKQSINIIKNKKGKLTVMVLNSNQVELL